MKFIVVLQPKGWIATIQYNTIRCNKKTLHKMYQIKCNYS